MDALLFLGLIIAGLAALDYAALRWGIDSRPGVDNRTPMGIVSVR
jgi:hypothetical protein